jgi:hypothetical protein
MGLGWWSQPNGRRRPGGRGRQQGHHIREFRVVGGDGCGRCSGEGATGGGGGGWGRVEATEHWSSESREAEAS